MTEIDFDSWEDYKPLFSGDSDGLDLLYKTVNESLDKNPNLVRLKYDDDFVLYGCNKDEIFDNCSELDYEGNSFIRFIKDDEIKDVEIFSCEKEEDVLLLIKDGNKYVTYVYQIGGYYIDDNKLTFTGWDYNVILNIDNMEFKTKNVR